MVLEAYEEEVLEAMYDNHLIGNQYSSIQNVSSRIKWQAICQKYGIKKKFSKVIKRLANKGYIDTHGKSGNVAALTKLGVLYVLGKKS
ncbi:MAG: hypothetical protein IAX21_01465 [Candidatus Bathyarchaeota archaeon]|nr:MAG: hypothetical protein NUK63_04330 [Candidatus Bathyarchaeum tardum]WNZ29567.1 MAG: hypothetical protein IAX21_01465 [Candidatus Bathyarchaeota archaeon]